MATMDRRRLLTAAVLGGATLAGATALGSLAPEDAFAATPAGLVDAGLPDPNFVEGRVTAVTGTMLLVTGSDGVIHAIRVTDATSIWKLRPATFDQIAVGDGLYARGVRLDGTLAADAVWVNIVSIHVHIASMARNQIAMEHYGSRMIGHVVPGVTAAVYNGTPAVSDMSLLRVGGHAHVIGAWRPDTNEIDIATIFSSA